MKIRSVLCLMLLCLCVGGPAHAKKKAKKKAIAPFKLLEAYTQRTLPGIKPGPGHQVPPPVTNFIIVWEAPAYPETFFWRGDVGWLTCRIEKAHKISGKSHMPPGKDYSIEMASGDQIHKGDTLMLTPVVGGKFPIPAEIPDTAKNTLFFKTGGRKWLSFHVSTISKKQDIAMP